MDGTLYLGGRLFPETLPFLDTLEKTARKYIFFTNNSSKSRVEYLEKLSAMGIKTSPERIITSGTATISHIRSLNSSAGIYLMGTPGLEKEFTDAGFNLKAAHPDFVVLGFDKTLTYKKIEEGAYYIKKGVPFIATHPDLVCPTEDGSIPDTGSMIEMFYLSTGVRPLVIGKPNPGMIEAALKLTKGTPEDTAMVGDRYYTDMEMGFRSGIKTVLVLSGETKREDVEGFKRKPDYVIENVGEITKAIKQG